MVEKLATSGSKIKISSGTSLMNLYFSDCNYPLNHTSHLIV
uniref:Uncharacterized protein n=1 Tax=Ascaris lumbricoides TaxID=6252 RepID=A0A0M3I296_ASCLU